MAAQRSEPGRDGPDDIGSTDLPTLTINRGDDPRRAGPHKSKASPANVQQKLGRYTLLGKLATGGMAELYLARQSGPQGFSKTVVIKRILQQFGRDKHFVEMFLNEARLAALLNHPNIVSIYELIEDAEQADYSIVMEFIDGRNLKSVVHGAIEREGSMPLHFAARIMADAAGALHYAHEMRREDGKPLGLVHRDISPENVLVTFGGQAKIVDFGIAKAAAREGLTATGQVKGKFAYMSPEQILGKGVDRRTDVWALGVTFYWMLAGVKPFRGDNELELIHKITESEPPPLTEIRPDVPPALVNVLMRALTKDPAKRTPTGAALQEELETWLATSGVVATTHALGTYLNKLFPVDTDPDRRLTQRILSGEMDGATPTDMPLGGLRGKPTTDVSMMRKRRSWLNSPWAAAAGAAAAVILVEAAVNARRATETQVTPVPVPVAAAPAAEKPSALPPLAPPPAALPPPVAPVAVEEHKAAPPRPRPVAEAEHHASPHHAAVAKGAPGTLVFKIVPWADVFVDGNHVGTTPFDPMELPSGKHEVRLVNERLDAEKTLTVVVKPGVSNVVSERLP